MITGMSERVVRISGLSTDEKPISKYIDNGSIFIEMDTSKIYLYDKEHTTWILTKFVITGSGDIDPNPDVDGPTIDPSDELTEEEVDQMLKEVFG